MLKPSVLYHLNQAKKSTIIYYIVMLFHLLAFALGARYISVNTANGTVEGLELATIIFIFVLGLNSFKENGACIANPRAGLLFLCKGPSPERPGP